MIRRLKKGLGLGAALLAVVLLLGIASPSRANFEVEFDYKYKDNNNLNQVAKIIIDGTEKTVTVSGGAVAPAAGMVDFSTPGSISIWNLVVSPTGAAGGFKISATIAESNSPGTPTVATLDFSSLTIKNQSGVAGNSSLTVKVGDTDFYGPPGPNVGLLSTLSVTASGSNTAGATAVFNSYLDSTNAQFGTQQGTLQFTLVASPGASAANNSFATLNSVATPYSLTQVAVFTLANGDKFTDGSSGTTVFAPAPPGLALLLSGLPFLGFGAWRRYRKQG